MNLWQQYLRPQNLSEAMQAFSFAAKPLAPIAGGTDLLLDLAQGRHSPVHTLIDVTEIKEMLALEVRDDFLFVGAGIPVNRIVADPLVAQHAQALVEACELIAGPQVRNVATLGGNVAHALPAADGTIALLALDAQAEIASSALSGASDSEKSRSVGNVKTCCIPFKELFLGPGKSSLKHGEELLIGFHLPLSTPHQASCFKRIMRPQGVALPILNCAIWLEREKDMVKDIRVAVGPGSSIPFRATNTEDSLRGKSFNEVVLKSVLDALLSQAQFRTSARRASSDYRQHIVNGLFRDTLETAWVRASNH